jgi:hypothetical protein
MIGDDPDALSLQEGEVGFHPHIARAYLSGSTRCEYPQQKGEE